MDDCTNTVPWDELSQSAQTTVVWWIKRLADGESGDVTFRCHGGGVRRITVEEVLGSYDDGSRRVRVKTYEPGELLNGDG